MNKLILKMGVLFLLIGMIACTSGSENNSNNDSSDNADAPTAQESEPQIDEAVVDSIANKVDELEAELDDILDGLE